MASSVDADVGRRRADVAFVIAAAVAASVILFVGRQLTFRTDEWKFIAFDSGSVAAYLEPHNEHWSTVPHLLYGAVLALVGLRSYLPYLGVLVAIHLVAVAGVYVLVRRRQTAWFALAVTLPLLLLGSGAENLLWAFQMGFVSSVAAGVWAFAMLEDRRSWAGPAAATVLVVSLAASAMGVFFLAASIVRGIIDPATRHRTVWLAIPVAAFVLWFLAYGRTGVGTRPVAGVADTAAFALRGTIWSVTRAFGLDGGGLAPAVGSVLGVALLAVGFGLLGWLVIVRRTMPALAVGAAVGLVGMYILIAYARAGLPGDFAGRSRYVYVAAPLLAVFLSDLLAGLFGRGRPPATALALLSPLLVVAIVANLLDLGTLGRILRTQAERTRAELTVIQSHPDATWMDEASLSVGMPRLGTLRGLLAKYGSPTRDAWLASAAPSPDRQTLDQAYARLAGSGFTVGPIGPGRPGVPTAALTDRDVAIQPAGRCIAVTPAGPAPSVTLEVPGGGGLDLSGDADATAWLGYQLPPTKERNVTVPLLAGQSAHIAVPDVGDGSTWQVRVAPTGPTTICTTG